MIVAVASQVPDFLLMPKRLSRAKPLSVLAYSTRARTSSDWEGSSRALHLPAPSLAVHTASPSNFILSQLSHLLSTMTSCIDSLNDDKHQ